MDKLLGKIQEAITTAQDRPKGREGALVITKLQEAEHWHRAALGLWSAPPEPERELGPMFNRDVSDEKVEQGSETVVDDHGGLDDDKTQLLAHLRHLTATQPRKKRSTEQ